MFASSIVSTLLGHTPENEWITVLNQGGFVKTKIYRDAQGNFVGELLGNTTNEFMAELEFDFENPVGARLENVQACSDETAAYEQVKAFAAEAWATRV